MTPEQAFDRMTVDGQIKFMDENTNQGLEAIRQEYAKRVVADLRPKYRELHYDVQEAIEPGLKKVRA